MKGDHLIIDPARAPFIRLAFERWATGTLTSTRLADELWQAGLVSVTNVTAA